jgi:hypothetical protein
MPALFMRREKSLLKPFVPEMRLPSKFENIGFSPRSCDGRLTNGLPGPDGVES